MTMNQEFDLGDDTEEIIGRGTWIASHVVITPGTTIGKGNMICAGAVVVKNTPDDVMVGGVPAKVIGPRKDIDEVVSKAQIITL